MSTRRPAQHTHPCTRIRTLQLTSQNRDACCSPLRTVRSCARRGSPRSSVALSTSITAGQVRAFDPAWAALYDLRADGARSLSTASARIAPCCLRGQRLHASACAEPQLCAVRACLLAAGMHVRSLAEGHPQRCAAGVAHAALQQARGGLIDTAPAQATADSRQATADSRQCLSSCRRPTYAGISSDILTPLFSQVHMRARAY